MAFDLRTNNLTGVAVIDQPGGTLATSENWISLYDYAMTYQPELISQLYMRNGKGSILGFMSMTGTESTFKADTIQHMEEGRLHNVLKNVAVNVATNVFTSPTAHNLRVGDEIYFSDGISAEYQATVTNIGSTTVFTALNNGTGAFVVGGNVTVMANFSNSFNKGAGQFATGRRWSPTPVVNYAHILKETYNVAKSNMVTNEWVQTNAGPRWFNHEMERTDTMFDNLKELTHIFYRRKTDASAAAAAGYAKGMKGVIQQVEERGNIANEYITTLTHLSNIAKRIKQQCQCTAFTVWADHTQMRYFREMMSGLNAGYVGGANYGVFQNSKEMALMLDFSSVLVDGITFHFTPWKVLEDVTLMGAAKFDVTGVACIIVPAGLAYAEEDGVTVQKPYLTFRHRSEGQNQRNKEVTIYGLPGNPNPNREDKMVVDYLAEITNQVIGANAYFVVRRGLFYV